MFSCILTAAVFILLLGFALYIADKSYWEKVARLREQVGTKWLIRYSFGSLDEEYIHEVDEAGQYVFLSSGKDRSFGTWTEIKTIELWEKRS